MVNPKAIQGFMGTRRSRLPSIVAESIVPLAPVALNGSVGDPETVKRGGFVRDVAAQACGTLAAALILFVAAKLAGVLGGVKWWEVTKVVLIVLGILAGISIYLSLVAALIAEHRNLRRSINSRR